MYPMNYYYGPYFRRPVQRLDQGGIPAIRSVAVERKRMMTTTTRIDPVDVIEMMTMKRWILPAPRTVMTGTIVTMTSLKCVVVEEDGECDGKGSLLFQQ